jgi:hypothetical protein
MDTSTLKRPSALVPIAMSATALLIVLLHLARYGVTREADEGTAAHLWQLLMAGQAIGILYFAVRWVPKNPRSALLVLALQVAMALAACAPVYWFQM